MSVIHGLCCHNAGVHDTRPDGERDQAAMFGRVTRRGNEVSAEDRVDPTDHLEVVLAMATVPPPSRRPNEAERVDGEEDCTKCNQGNLEEFFARDVIHAESPVRQRARTTYGRSAGLLTRAIDGNWATKHFEQCLIYP